MTRYLLPLGVFLALVILLGIGLGLDPRLVPSRSSASPRAASRAGTSRAR